MPVLQSTELINALSRRVELAEGVITTLSAQVHAQAADISTHERGLARLRGRVSVLESEVLEPPVRRRRVGKQRPQGAPAAAAPEPAREPLKLDLGSGVALESTVRSAGTSAEGVASPVPPWGDAGEWAWRHA